MTGPPTHNVGKPD